MNETPENTMPGGIPSPIKRAGEWKRSASDESINFATSRPSTFCPPRLFVIIAAVSVATGIAVNLLFGGVDSVGFNISLVGLIFFTGWFVASRQTGVPMWRKACAVAAVAYAFAMALRASEILYVVNLLLVLGFTGLACSPAYTSNLKSPWSTALDAAQVGFNVLLGWIVFLLEFPWRSFKTGKASAGVAPRIVTGVVISVPFLFIFGMLFAKAEAGFGSIFERLFELIANLGFTHFWLTFWASVFAMGLLRSAFIGHSLTDNAGSPHRKPALVLGMVESATVLTLLNALFLLFVITQLPYMFGGQDRVSSTPNLAWSDYARRGFFELAWVAALLMPTLMLLINGTRTDTDRQRKTIIGLGFGLTGLGALVIVSALQRMLLYTANFGLTELRIYVSTFIVMIGVVLVILNVLNVVRRSHLFLPLCVVTGVVFSIGIQVPNVQGMIARDIVHRELSGKDGDMDYLRRLSPDAVPAIVASPLPDEEKQSVVLDILPTTRVTSEDDACGREVVEPYNWLEQPWSTGRGIGAYKRMWPDAASVM